MSVHRRLPLAGLIVCLLTLAAGRTPADVAEPGAAVAPEPPAAEATAAEVIADEEPVDAPSPTDDDTAAPEPTAADPDLTIPPEPATESATADAAAPGPEEVAEGPDEEMLDTAGDENATIPGEEPGGLEGDETGSTPEPADEPATEPDAVPAPAAPEPTSATEAAPATTTGPVAGKPVPQATTKPVPPKKPVLVPGTGTLVAGIGDDFEDEGWKWSYHHPKSSEEQDKRMRGPMGRSANGRWFEGPKRGTPDVVKRIELPAPGLEGSQFGLLIATLNAGIPGRVTYQMQQDDLIYNMQKVTGRGIPVGDSPSVVTRVYFPPFEQWERRSGPTFGFRAGCYTHAIITGEDHPDRGKFGLEEYWPGMFVCFEPANAKKGTADSAYLRIRGGRNGGEIRGPQIDVNGWWTLGLSFSPDGMVHYFASPGVDALTMEDHITSQFPYGYRTEWLKTFFFNVCTRDDGKTWSTPWVIDDPQVSFSKRQLAITPPPTRKSR